MTKFFTLRKLAHAMHRGCKNYKICIFPVDFKYFFKHFCTKHCLWVHVRSGSNGSQIKKIRKNVYPSMPKFYNINVVFKGVFIARTCLSDEMHILLQNCTW